MTKMIDPEAIDAIVKSVFDAARVPGGAVAVVADGETVFAKGYGTRNEARDLPVEPSTLYPIASTTKAINATLIGMLVDDCLLGWDDPVQQHLPHFRLSDPVRSSQVTIRDCLAMRTGLPRHDWVWLSHEGAREDLIERIAHLELSAGFRERYQYNNLAYVVTGILIERLTGARWEELVLQRILKPLGMTKTIFDRTLGDEVTCSWHERADRTLLPTHPSQGDFVTAPAGGSIHSTVLDMTHWLKFNLDGGKVGGRQLIRPETLAEIHSPQMVVGKDPTATSPHAAYGLGWSIDHYQGSPRITHSGYLDDVSSDIALFPEQQIGIVCFANFGAPRVPKVITARIFDQVMGLAPLKSVQNKLAQYEQAIADTKRDNDEAGRVKNTRPSHPLANYAGDYSHPGYGEIKIALEEGQLCFHFSKLEVPLEHWHYDSWVAAPSDDFAIHEAHCFDRNSRMLFETDKAGAIAAVTIPFEPDASPIRFSKTPAAQRLL